jgi:hypothetical protein
MTIPGKPTSAAATKGVFMKTWGRVLYLGLLFSFGFAMGPARAASDEASIIKLIEDGRYEELRSLEGAAKGEDPVAQFWWGRLLKACVYERCEPEHALRLWERSARAGYGRAREMLFGTTAGGVETDELIKAIGRPATKEEQLLWAVSTFGSLAEGPSAGDAVSTLGRAATQPEPTMFALSMAGTMGYVSGFDETALRAIIAAGFPQGDSMAEALRRRLRVIDRTGYPEQLAKAKAGDVVLTTALCQTVSFMEGQQQFDADLLPLCVKVFEGGQLGVAPALLRHYLDRGDMAQAGRYADYCMRLPIRCDYVLGEYLSAKLGPESSAWREWDAVLALQGGMDPSEVETTRENYRKGLSRAIWTSEIARQCLARQYRRETRTFTEAAGCPWGKPPQ